MCYKEQVKKFRRDLHGQVTIEAVIRYLQSIGYTVISYQSGVNNDYLIINDLVEYSKTVPAFTFCDDNNRFVFVDDTQSTDDKLYALLHETAHIILGHLDKKGISYNERLAEMQAEAFAYEVLNSDEHKAREILIVVILSVLMFCAPFIIGHFTGSDTPVVNDDSITAVDDIVYITPTGKKYHRKSCIYTKDKKCTAVSKAEAEKTYDPCAVCNP